MQAIDVTRHSKDNTTAGSIYHRTLLRLLFPVCMQKKLLMTFGTTLVHQITTLPTDFHIVEFSLHPSSQQWVLHYICHL